MFKSLSWLFESGGPRLALDFGIRETRAAVLERAGPKILQTRAGLKSTPTVVGFHGRWRATYRHAGKASAGDKPQDHFFRN
jgi:molecular chaperone DnaK (HSP70)